MKEKRRQMYESDGWISCEGDWVSMEEGSRGGRSYMYISRRNR